MLPLSVSQHTSPLTSLSGHRAPLLRCRTSVLLKCIICRFSLVSDLYFICADINLLLLNKSNTQYQTAQNQTDNTRLHRIKQTIPNCTESNRQHQTAQNQTDNTKLHRIKKTIPNCTESNRQYQTAQNQTDNTKLHRIKHTWFVPNKVVYFVCSISVH